MRAATIRVKRHLLLQRWRAVSFVLMAALGAGCPRPPESAPPPAPEATPPKVVVEDRLTRWDLSLDDVWCEGLLEGCWALGVDKLFQLGFPGGQPELTEVGTAVGWTILDYQQGELFVVGQQNGGWWRAALGPAEARLGEAIPLDVGVAEPPRPDEIRLEYHNVARRGLRAPFRAVQPTRDGAMLMYRRGGWSGQSSLVRVGGAMRAVPAPGTIRGAVYPAWISVHPRTGEGYLLPWPGAQLLAFDPETLATQWVVELRSAARALFVDPSGRYLVIAQGGEVQERLLDWGVPGIMANEDPASDLVLRTRPRPHATSVVVVDTTRPAIVAVVEGDYRRWQAWPGGFLLLTDRELLTLER